MQQCENNYILKLRQNTRIGTFTDYKCDVPASIFEAVWKLRGILLLIPCVKIIENDHYARYFITYHPDGGGRIVWSCDYFKISNDKSLDHILANFELLSPGFADSFVCRKWWAKNKHSQNVKNDYIILKINVVDKLDE